MGGGGGGGDWSPNKEEIKEWGWNLFLLPLIVWSD